MKNKRFWLKISPLAKLNKDLMWNVLNAFLKVVTSITINKRPNHNNCCTQIENIRQIIWISLKNYNFKENIFSNYWKSWIPYLANVHFHNFCGKYFYKEVTVSWNLVFLHSIWEVGFGSKKHFIFELKHFILFL